VRTIPNLAVVLLKPAFTWWMASITGESEIVPSVRLTICSCPQKAHAKWFRLGEILSFASQDGHERVINLGALASIFNSFHNRIRHHEETSLHIQGYTSYSLNGVSAYHQTVQTVDYPRSPLFFAFHNLLLLYMGSIN
jgi:hypothetical protein